MQLIKSIRFALWRATESPHRKRSYEAFKDHIKLGTILIHDKENTHRKLVEKLSLNRICYASKDLKDLADSE